jgi:hypothetical protein
MKNINNKIQVSYISDLIQRDEDAKALLLSDSFAECKCDTCSFTFPGDVNNFKQKSYIINILGITRNIIHASYVYQKIRLTNICPVMPQTRVVEYSLEEVFDFLPAHLQEKIVFNLDLFK